MVSSAMLAMSSLSNSSATSASCPLRCVLLAGPFNRDAFRNGGWVSPGCRSNQHRSDCQRDIPAPLPYGPLMVSLLRSSGSCRLRVRARGARGVEIARDRDGRLRPRSSRRSVSKWYGQVIGLNDVSLPVPRASPDCGARTAPASPRYELRTGQCGRAGVLTVLEADLAQHGPVCPHRLLPNRTLVRADDGSHGWAAKRFNGREQ